jgi:hypothetical protein
MVTPLSCPFSRQSELSSRRWRSYPERRPVEELRHAVDLIVVAAIRESHQLVPERGPSQLASRGDGGAANGLRSIIKK